MRLVQPIDQHAFVIGLAKVDLEAELARASRPASPRYRRGYGAVNLRLARAEQVEVGAVQDEDGVGHGDPGLAAIGGLRKAAMLRVLSASSRISAGRSNGLVSGESEVPRRGTLSRLCNHATRIIELTGIAMARSIFATLASSCTGWSAGTTERGRAKIAIQRPSAGPSCWDLISADIQHVRHRTDIGKRSSCPKSF